MFPPAVSRNLLFLHIKKEEWPKPLSSNLNFPFLTSLANEETALVLVVNYQSSKAD